MDPNQNSKLKVGSLSFSTATKLVGSVNFREHDSVCFTSHVQIKHFSLKALCQITANWYIYSRILVSHSRSVLDQGKASEREGKNENKRDSLSTTKVVTTCGRYHHYHK